MLFLSFAIENKAGFPSIKDISEGLFAIDDLFLDLEFLSDN
jgi:hypothetical protein